MLTTFKALTVPYSVHVLSHLILIQPMSWGLFFSFCTEESKAQRC